MKYLHFLFLSALLAGCAANPATPDEEAARAVLAEAPKEAPLRPAKAAGTTGKPKPAVTPASTGAKAATPDAKGGQFLSYIERIQKKVERKAQLPADIPKGLQASFRLIQSRDGEVLSIRVNSPSGYRPYDVGLERAIRECSPLPRVQRDQDFQPEILLNFRT